MSNITHSVPTSGTDEDVQRSRKQQIRAILVSYDPISLRQDINNAASGAPKNAAVLAAVREVLLADAAQKEALRFLVKNYEDAITRGR